MPPLPTTHLPAGASSELPSPEPSLSQLPHLAGLDNLRAVAALLVCLFHFGAGALPERETVPLIKAIFGHGYLGVEIFFVISGFIIPYSLLGQHYQLRQFGAYLRRRLVRLLPPAYVVMLLTVAQWQLAERLLGHAGRPDTDLGWHRVLHNLLLTVPLVQEGWLVSVCWTLAVEFQFYLLLGLLFPLLFGPGRLGWFLGFFGGWGRWRARYRPPQAFC